MQQKVQLEERDVVNTQEREQKEQDEEKEELQKNDEEEKQTSSTVVWELVFDWSSFQHLNQLVSI